MQKEMVISSLTIYAIAFSCVTLLIGKSIAASAVQTDVTNLKNDRKNHNKIQLPNVKNGEVKQEKIKVVQSHYLPSKTIPNQNLSLSDIKSLNESHSYFALYDPVRNETRKFEVIGANGPIPSEISASDLGVFGGKKPDEGRGKGGKEKKNKRKHPWDKTNGNGRIRNFISRDTLKDSETEIRVHYNGLTAKETTVKTGIDEETGQR